MRQRAVSYIYFLFFIATLNACGSKAEIPLDTKDVFFNTNMLEGILDVEEAQRYVYLKQFTDKSIYGRGDLVSVSEASSFDGFAKYGKYELLAQVPNILRDIGVEYRIYVEESLGQALFHKRVIIGFKGKVLEVEWNKTGGRRRLRIFLIGEKIDLLE